MVTAVRGATTVDNDDREKVIERVLEMVDTLFLQNQIESSTVISILFSVTDDIQSINPAAALRAGGGYHDVPLFCSQEPKSNGSLKKAVRVLITWNGSGKSGKPCYLHGATILRPDLK